MYALMINSLKTTPAVRRILPCAFYHPHPRLHAPQQQVNPTTKVDDFYINSSYPDDSETPPTMTQRRTSVPPSQKWDETNATQSEADVKADRGEAKTLNEIVESEAEMEPKIDEM
ncbi:uncharacterized protein BJX67DRAFT_379822 [Aspergillus lucknowensis]|uniref:Uncharacterized protein n=1 Tax=Aspergillus lucknowensis TaxID=176173 RepID=A0ABR4LWN6_9EURO